MTDRDLIREMAEALAKLTNEVGGIVDLARPSIGNTNARVLLTRVDEADAALTAARERLAREEAQPAPEPAEPVAQEHVAEVMPGWSLAWAGREPIATLLARHPSVRIGTKLYASPPRPAPVALLSEEEIGNIVLPGSVRAKGEWACILFVARAVEAEVRRRLAGE